MPFLCVTKCKKNTLSIESLLLRVYLRMVCYGMILHTSSRFVSDSTILLMNATIALHRDSACFRCERTMQLTL